MNGNACRTYENFLGEYNENSDLSSGKGHQFTYSIKKYGIDGRKASFPSYFGKDCVVERF